MNKRWVFATAAAAALVFASGAQAQTLLSGEVSGTIGYSDLEVGGFEADATHLSVEGRVAGSFGQSLWSWQGDASYEYIDSDDLGDEPSIVRAQAHVFYNDADRYAIGGHVGVIHEGEIFDDTLYGGGIEGDVRNGQWGFGAGVAYYTADDADVDVYGLSGDVTYYFDDNIAIDGGATIGQIDISGLDEVDYYELRLRGRYGFREVPVTVGLELSYDEIDDIDADAFQIMATATWNFSTGTISQRDRQGASREGARDIVPTLIR